MKLKGSMQQRVKQVFLKNQRVFIGLALTVLLAVVAVCLFQMTGVREPLTLAQSGKQVASKAAGQAAIDASTAARASANAAKKATNIATIGSITAAKATAAEAAQASQAAAAAQASQAAAQASQAAAAAQAAQAAQAAAAARAQQAATQQAAGAAQFAAAKAAAPAVNKAATDFKQAVTDFKQAVDAQKATLATTQATYNQLRKVADEAGSAYMTKFEGLIRSGMPGNQVDEIMKPMRDEGLKLLQAANSFKDQNSLAPTSNDANLRKLADDGKSIYANLRKVADEAGSAFMTQFEALQRSGLPGNQVDEIMKPMRDEGLKLQQAAKSFYDENRSILS